MRRFAVVGIAAAIGIVAYLWLRGGDDSHEAPRDAAPLVESASRARLRALQREAPAGIEGTVRAQAAPSAALVCAWRWADPDHPDELDDGPACAPAGVDGRYTLAGLAPGAYTVWASAPRSTGVHREVTLAAGARETVDLDLVGARASARGRVTDVRGVAIAGARIHAERRGAIHASTETDADGRFEVWTNEDSLELRAGAEGFVETFVDTFVPAADLAIELLPESVLAGIVVDATTHVPVADATVDVGTQAAKTDDSGRFRVRGLAPGRYKPTARAIGGYGEARESVRLGLGVTVDGVVLEVHPCAVVAGRIVTPSGAGCADGSVHLWRVGGDANFLGRTRGDGEVLIEGVVPGIYQARFWCKDHLAGSPSFLVVADSDVEDVVWPVSSGVSLSGRVTANHAPVAGARVSFLGSEAVGSATTAPDGTYTLTGVTPGELRVIVQADGYQGGMSTVTVSSRALTGVDFALAPLAESITGVLVDRAGAPVRGHLILAAGPDRPRTAWTDGAGAFVFRDLPAGRHVVTQEVEWGDPPEPDGLHAVEVAVGQGVTRVRLVRDVASGTLEVVVVDARGTPVRDAYVDLGREAAEDGLVGWQSRPRLVRTDGSIVFGNLPGPPDRYAVRAFQQGGAQVQQRGVSLGTRTRLVLPATGVLAGTIVEADGTPVEDAKLEALDLEQDVRRSERVFRTGGRFALRELPPGRYQVTVNDDVRSMQVLELAAGQQRDELRFVLSRRYAIRGRLVGADGTPRAGWTVEVAYDEVDLGRRGLVTRQTIVPALAEADGRFLVPGLGGDTATIRAVAPLAVEGKELATVPLRGASTILDVGELVVR